MSATASRICASRPSSSPSPRSRRWSAAVSSGGRGRLPVCVVRMCSVERFTALSSGGGCVGIQRPAHPGASRPERPLRTALTARPAQLHHPQAAARQRVQAVRAAAHPEPLGEAQRPRVALVDDRHDRAQAEALEAEVDARARGLGRQARAPTSPAPAASPPRPPGARRAGTTGSPARRSRCSPRRAARGTSAQSPKPCSSQWRTRRSSSSALSAGVSGRFGATQRMTAGSAFSATSASRSSAGRHGRRTRRSVSTRRMDHGPEPSRMGLQTASRPAVNQGDAVPSHLRYRPPGRSAKGAPGSRWRASQPRGLALCGSVPRLRRTYSGAFGEVKDARRKRSANCGDSCVRRIDA